MSLKDTVEIMRGLLALITVDLEKAVNGNKAASQRVRTATIRLEKVAKLYRKESIRGEKPEKARKTIKKNSYSKPTSKLSARSGSKMSFRSVAKKNTGRR